MTSAGDKLWWEQRAHNPLSGTEQTRPPSRNELCHRRVLWGYFSNQDGVLLKTDSWNEAVRKNFVDISLLPKACIVIMDIARNTVRLAKKNCPNHDYVNCDLNHLPFRKRVFDGILDLSTSDHIPFFHFNKIMQDYKRILKVHGELLLIFSKKNHFYSCINLLHIKLRCWLKRREKPIPYTYSYYFDVGSVRQIVSSHFHISHECSVGMTLLEQFKFPNLNVPFKWLFASHLIKAFLEHPLPI